MRALVFDSGVGGLTIARELARLAPGWTIDYAADAGFFPYGLKADDELKARLPPLCAALVEASGADLLVVACNTATTLAVADIRAAVSVPVVGTAPAIKPAAERTQTGVIGLLATPGTVRRAYLDDLEARFASGRRVIRRGSSLLVELAERAARGEEPDPADVAAELAPMFAAEDGAQIDIVVLACTHFPLIREAIAAACPPGVTLIDSGEAVARQALRVAPAEMARSGDAAPARALVTGGSANRASLAGVLARFGYHQVDVVDV